MVGIFHGYVKLPDGNVYGYDLVVLLDLGKLFFDAQLGYLKYLYTSLRPNNKPLTLTLSLWIDLMYIKLLFVLFLGV